MDFKDWPKEDLVKYLDFLLHNYRVMDAFWFINLEQAYGMDTACDFNEKVWGRVAQLAARDLKQRFNITETGLSGWVKAQKLFPWSTLVGYHYIEGDGFVEVEVPECPAQRGRLDRDLGEYPCKGMHLAEFKGFAGEIDPRIQVECLYAPPDPHPKEFFCRWRFTLKD